MRVLAKYFLSASLVVCGCPRVALADTATASGSATIQAQDGQQIYQHVCQGCHMADAKGAVGAASFPPLAHNPKLENAGYPISVILNGYGGMPWFNGVLSDPQIADVVNYLRSHFGNDYKDVVTAADVAAVRGPAPHMER